MKYLVILFSLLLSSFCFADSYPVVERDTPFLGSRFYTPNDGQKHTSVIMLHGSEGGSEPYIDSEANILATQGYAVLVLCYFDCNRLLVGPRQTLKNVEATLVLDAVTWIRKQSSANSKVVVYGLSRGAELIMIVGSLSMTSANHPNALIAHSPSDVFVGPWNWSWSDPACWLCKAGIGKCSVTAAKSDYQWNPSCGPDDPGKMDFSKSAWLISGVNIIAGQRIEIEKYSGPILITVGDKDEIWPVDQTRRIEATLKAAGRSPEIHYFPNEGHVFSGSDEVTRRELVMNFLKRVP